MLKITDLVKRYGNDKPVLKMTADDWNKVISVNLSGAFYMSKPALAHMIERGTGRIVNINSGTMNAAATHSESPITRKIFVSEDIQKPDVIPWKKNASHKTENTLPADPGRAT